jgi:hypothetical protein
MEVNEGTPREVEREGSESGIARRIEVWLKFIIRYASPWEARAALARFLLEKKKTIPAR